VVLFVLVPEPEPERDAGVAVVEARSQALRFCFAARVGARARPPSCDRRQ
jgi:hypothetical protein